MAGVHSLVHQGDRLSEPYNGRRPASIKKRILILLLADLLAITLACKRFFHTLLFTWF
jgi:hypothetical protein